MSIINRANRLARLLTPLKKTGADLSQAARTFITKPVKKGLAQSKLTEGLATKYWTREARRQSMLG